MQIGLSFFALAALWALQKPESVASAEPSERIFELDDKLTRLERKFQNGYRKLFYGPQVTAEQEQNYALLELAIEMVESDAILYAHQRRGLLAAQRVINDHFVTRIAPLSPVLVPSSDLVDMIIKRSIAQSIKSGFYAIEYRRKKIYLIAKENAAHPKVLALSRIYAWSTSATEGQETRATKEFEDLLNRYKEDVPFLWSAARLSQTLSAIDELIGRAAGQDLDEKRLLKEYIDPAVLVELFMARHRTKDKFKPLLPEQISSVSMRDIVVYEDKIIQESEGIGSYLKDLDGKLKLMDDVFDQTIQEMFYEQQHMGITKSNYPLLAISSYMADTEALMYAEERRMLTVIRDLIEQHEPEMFSKFLSFDKNLIYIIEHRLLMFAVERIIARATERKKKLYLMLRRYDSKDGIKELAREHIQHINSRKLLLEQIQMSLHLYLRTIWGAIPERRRAVDHLVNLGITLWSAGLEEAQLLQTNLDPSLFRDLLRTRQRSFKKIYRASGASIDAVTPREIAEYESELFGFSINITNPN